MGKRRSCGSRQGRRALGVAAVLLALLQPSAGASPTGATEYRVKAAFLYKFAKFIDWPADALGPADATFDLCVIGDDPFGKLLDQTVAGKRVSDHPVAVRRIASLDGSDGCRVLFISASERERLSRLLPPLRHPPVLTVGDVEGFAESGGMVNLKLEARRVRLQINPGVAKRAGLKIDAELLSLAEVVKSDAR